MNLLPKDLTAKVIHLLVEGNSIRSIARITADQKTGLGGVGRYTIGSIIMGLGRASHSYQYQTLRNLKSKRIECDEIWSFCRAKEKRLPYLEHLNPSCTGDLWTWIAIDPDTKLVPCWLIGKRTQEYAEYFIEDLASRLDNRVQITSDGLRHYMDAIKKFFGKKVDYSILVKSILKKVPKTGDNPIDSFHERMIGKPKEKFISTSMVERQNATLRNSCRRFTRKVYGFSKDSIFHDAAVNMHFMHYNFVRIHSTLGTTPAIAAGVTKEKWAIEDLVDMYWDYSFNIKSKSKNFAWR